MNYTTPKIPPFRSRSIPGSHFQILHFLLTLYCFDFAPLIKQGRDEMITELLGALNHAIDGVIYVDVEHVGRGSDLLL